MSKKPASFLLGGIAALTAAAVLQTPLRVAALGVGIFCFMLAGTALSRAGQLAGPLQRFRDRPVRILVWGAPVPAAGEPPMEIGSVKAAGAGLLILLREDPRRTRHLLKVAQPGPARFEEDRLEIEDARYVSWKGIKLAHAAGHPALKIQCL